MAMQRSTRVVVAVVTGMLLLSVAAGTGTGSPSSTDPKIVFSRGDVNVGTAIWTVNGDGSDLVQITHPPKAALDNEPVWSPNRRQIAFVREVVVGTNDRDDYIYREHLMVVSADGGTPRRLAVHSRHPAWSPDGGRIAFVKGYGGDPKIWLIAPDGSGARQLALGENPVWSPDARQIAFDRYSVTGDRWDTFIMNASGNRQRKLLPRFKDDNFTPDWSPDGRQIALFGCQCEIGLNVSIYIVDRSGAHLKKLTGGVASKDASSPRWSPHGSTVLFEREADNGDFDSTFVINSSGGGLQRIATATDYPTWSPDGRSIAFAKDYSSLRVVKATGGAAKFIARGDVRDIDW